MKRRKEFPQFKWAYIIGLILIMAVTVAASHKFYVSVTHLEFSDKDQMFQMTTRIFIDDLEAVLNARYEVDANLTEKHEIPDADSLIVKYLKSKIDISINGEPKQLNYLGKKYQDDVVVCYLEIPSSAKNDLRSVEIRNEVLTEMFDEQQNVVHLKIGDIKKSFILVRENNKGMLNL